MSEILTSLAADVRQWAHELPGYAAHDAMQPLLQCWQDAQFDITDIPAMQQDLQHTIAYLMDLQLRLASITLDTPVLPESIHTSLRSGAAISEWVQQGAWRTRQWEQLHHQWLGQWPETPSAACLSVEQAFAPYLNNNDIVTQISDWLQGRPAIGHAVRDALLSRQQSHEWARQRMAVVGYWLLGTKRQALLRDWPLDRGIVRLMATDLGISLRGW